MDKNAIKKYAVWARRELISRVSQKAQQFGITEKEIVDANADSVNGRLLSPDEKKQRQALIAKIKREDYEQVMEEVAYGAPPLFVPMAMAKLFFAAVIVPTL
jgi:formaldehyde-activating enzyme involved in methanogenesis